MKVPIFLALFAFVVSAPVEDSSKEGGPIILDNELFKEEFKIYTAEHDIVNIIVPVNDLNFLESGENKDDDAEMLIFFVIADTKDNGDKIDQGLYSLKGGNAKKLLDNGRDATCEREDGKLCYFGAKEGIFKYNEEKNVAEKFGTVEEDIVALSKVSGDDEIYILTANKEIFKVTDEGTKKTKLDAVKDATQLVLDNYGNVFYMDTQKDVYVVHDDGVKKVTGLPEKRDYIKLVRPMFIMEKVPVIVDDKIYVMAANGTGEYGNIDLKVNLTAFGPEFGLIHYYAHEKNIYEFNIVAMVILEIFEDFKTAVQDMEGKMQNFYSHSSAESKSVEKNRV